MSDDVYCLHSNVYHSQLLPYTTVTIALLFALGPIEAITNRIEFGVSEPSIN
jgi:hypothetical protein